MGGQGAAGSEDHCPRALMEHLSITKLDLGAWAQWVWKMLKVQSGGNCFRAQDATCTAPAVLVHSLNCPQSASPLSLISFPV